MEQKINWQSIGYADGMALCTKANKTTQYPTQDKYPPQAEADYLAGYHGAIHDFQMGNGFQTIAAYMTEQG